MSHGPVRISGRSRAAAGVGYRGVVHAWVWLALTKCWHDGLRIESNYAREKRWAISFAASVGWISVVSPDGLSYGRTWRITTEGLMALQHHSQGEA